MLAYPIATALLLLGQGSSAAAAKKQTSNRTRKLHPEKPNFMRKMDGHKKHARRRLSVKEFQAELYGDSKKSAELRKKVIEKSTVVKPPDGDGGNKRKLQNYNNNNANADSNNGNAYYVNGQAAYDQQMYSDANNAYNNNAYSYQNNNANNANNPYNNNGHYVYGEDGTVQYKYSAEKDGSDDYFQTYGAWENAFGFDVTQFSLSYHRCAAVRQFDDEIAALEDTDSVFATKRFAVFRFCPARTCMGFEEQQEEWECDEDTYGEAYCEALEEYMEAMEANAQNYQAYGNGWNGWNQNGGYDQANNWRNVNQGKYQNNNGEYCACAQNADQDDQEEECECANYAPYGGNNQGDEEPLNGARGEGCQSNYGEYMMEMDQYLQLMMEWQEERFEQYCVYCEECMFDVYEAWIENGGQGQQRKLEFEEFKNSEEHRNLGANFYNICPEYDTCTQYSKTCDGEMVDNFSDYFECTEVESSNNQVAYIGPHCSEDGFTISVGVYSDEYCNEYIGDGVDVANFIGQEIDIEEDIYKDYYNSAFGATLSQLDYINEENVCIPCAESDELWVDRAYDNGSRGNYDDDGDDDGYGKAKEINELCQNMYLVTARCDKHYRSYKNKSKQAKYAEAVAQEDLTCDFINSIVMGNYNEMGEIDMGESNFNRGGDGQGWLANNMYAQQYGQAISKVSPLQIFGLIVSILAVCSLATWSITLHNTMAKTGPWRPRRGLRSQPPGGQSSTAAADVSRQNSGIMLGRSASNTSYYTS